MTNKHDSVLFMISVNCISKRPNETYIYTNIECVSSPRHTANTRKRCEYSYIRYVTADANVLARSDRRRAVHFNVECQLVK